MAGHVCEVCRGELSVCYSGRVREGRFGNFSKTKHTVMKCADCGSARLFDGESSPSPYLAEEYTSGVYRNKVDGAQGSAKYFQTHDPEQLTHLSYASIGDLRGKVCADVGCGAGSFLDFIAGAAAATIAIEPDASFRKDLSARGHKPFPYTQDALPEWKGRIHRAFCFSVLEHIEHPVPFLSEISQLLDDGGELILSTPNADDALLEILPSDYAEFFYRRAHLWYFNAKSLTALLKKAGFREVEVRFHQRFPIGNFLLWLRDKHPQGSPAIGFLSNSMDKIWKSELESNGRADYLFVRARK